MNNKELCHIWAQQEKSEGKGSNLFFEGATIYSYGHHFPIAKIVGNIVLFTTKSYSVTTAKHKNYVLYAINQYNIIYCDDVIASFEEQHKNNVELMKKEIELLRLKIAKSLTRGEDYLRFFNKEMENLKSYIKLFKLKNVKIPKEYNQKEAIKIVNKQKQAEKIRKQREKIEQEKIKQNTLDLLPKWKNHIELTDQEKELKTNISYLGYDCLRIASDCENIETSRGAIFPIEHAKKAYPLILLAIKNMGWIKNGHSIHLGNYTIDSIDANGDIHAGCHFVPFSEVKEIAEKLGI